jgi:hypothetical protein
MTVQWFPGHMHATRKAIGERLKAGIDVVIELLDARLPGSSSNLLAESGQGRAQGAQQAGPGQAQRLGWERNRRLAGSLAPGKLRITPATKMRPRYSDDDDCAPKGWAVPLIEILYGMIRHPASSHQEIGAGSSTLMAQKAIQMNRQDHRAQECAHVCVEPYENAWRRRARNGNRREKVEDPGLIF